MAVGKAAASSFVDQVASSSVVGRAASSSVVGRAASSVVDQVASSWVVIQVASLPAVAPVAASSRAVRHHPSITIHRSAKAYNSTATKFPTAEVEECLPQPSLARLPYRHS